MNSKFHLTPTILPPITLMNNVNHSNDDVMWDWHAFQIPKGTAKITGIQGIIHGTDVSTSNGAIDFQLMFATSVDGVAPPTIGDSNDADNPILSAAVKPWIIGSIYFDASGRTDSIKKPFASYAVISEYTGQYRTAVDNFMIQGDTNFGGDSNHSATVEGYQTVWVAAFAQGAFNFGSGVLLDGAITSGNAGAQTLDVSEDVDADDVFAVGDELIALASDGSSEQRIGTITALTADTITVNAKDVNGTTVWASGALADDDEICLYHPIRLRFALEY